MTGSAGALPPVSVRLLGPVGLTVGAAPVDLGTPKQRAVFAALGICSGQVVSAEHLTTELWGPDAPVSARATLQVYVSRLRRSLADASADGAGPRVLLRAPGYLLDVPDGAVDAQRFARLLSAARRTVDEDPSAALAGLDLALATAVGPPLSDVVEHLGPTTAAEVARLEEMVLLARETRLTALLALGDAAAVAGEAAALVQQHPLREQLHGLLVLALYRSGRQADALAAFDGARQRLLDELGVDPGGALRRLHAQVLAQDPALDPDVPAPLPRHDAAARAADSAPAPVGRSVPTPLTSFVGRRPDLVRLGGLVAAHRLVTATGIGGTGKTRLAVQLASSRRDADGPWFVDLAPVTEADVLLDVLGSTLGVLAAQGLPAVVQALAGRELLLVLDNCEQLLEPVAELVAALLASCPGVRVLATSRLPLDVDGEVVLELAPLDPAGDAVELFHERARAAAPDWRPDAQDEDAIGVICRELDGLPLAIELAARHSRTLTPAQIAAELDDRFALLRTAPAGSRARSARRSRGASVEAAVAWSVERLSPPAVATFRRAAVFEGGFDLEALTAVSQGDAVGAVLELVDAGLVSVVREGATRRYRMLMTVRQYAARTSPPEQLLAARQAHLAWFAALAAELQVDLRGHDAAWSFTRLEAELPNARVALATALEDGDGDAARSIVGDLGWFWFRRAHLSEGMRWSLAALASAPGEEVDATTRAASAHRGRALLTTVTLMYLAGRLDVLEPYGTQAVEWAERADDWPTLALGLCSLAYHHAYAGRAEIAFGANARAERTAREHGPSWALGDVLALRGQLLRTIGDLAGALAVTDEAIAVTAASGHVWGHVSALWIGAKVALDVDRPDLAAVRMRTAVDALAEDGDVSSLLVVLHLLAGAVARLGRPAQGAELLGAIDAVVERTGFSPQAMDPVDSPRNVAAVRDALPPAAFDQHFRTGRALDRDQVLALVRSLDLTPLRVG